MAVVMVHGKFSGYLRLQQRGRTVNLISRQKVPEGVIRFHRNHITGQRSIRVHQFSCGGANHRPRFPNTGQLFFQFILCPYVIRVQKRDVFSLCQRDSPIACFRYAKILLVSDIADLRVFEILLHHPVQVVLGIVVDYQNLRRNFLGKRGIQRLLDIMAAVIYGDNHGYQCFFHNFSIPFHFQSSVVLLCRWRFSFTAWRTLSLIL